MINKKKNTNYGYFNVSQQIFLWYRIADDFVFVVMKRHLCVEARLSALSAANLTSNGLIDRFDPWLPGWFMTSIASGKREITLATHVLQFIFLGFSGFRFPLFHFPTNTATASELVMFFLENCKFNANLWIYSAIYKYRWGTNQQGLLKYYFVISSQFL